MTILSTWTNLGVTIQQHELICLQVSLFPPVLQLLDDLAVDPMQLLCQPDGQLGNQQDVPPPEAERELPDQGFHCLPVQLLLLLS